MIHFCLSFTLALGFLGHKQELLASESDEIAKALALRPGQSVADVGAGDGEWTEEMSRAVGKSGLVYATEVDESRIAQLRRRFEDGVTGNVSVVRGAQETTGLPTSCCDAILLRLVYHHFTEPEEMVADLRRVLRPGGRVVVVDMLPQEHIVAVPGVPDRGGHGVHPDDVVNEMGQVGFRVAARYDNWAGRSERFCLVFTYDAVVNSSR
jgi:ubiquinone/menaquinone biosynthesis C-methylase UbiE